MKPHPTVDYSSLYADISEPIKQPSSARYRPMNRKQDVQPVTLRASRHIQQQPQQETTTTFNLRKAIIMAFILMHQLISAGIVDVARRGLETTQENVANYLLSRGYGLPNEDISDLWEQALLIAREQLEREGYRNDHN